MDRTSASVVLAAVIAMTSGCSQRPIAAAPRVLAGHAAALTHDGRAAIAILGEDRPVMVRADTVVAVQVADGPGSIERRLTIGELVAGCEQPAPAAGADPAPARCLAEQVLDDELVVAHRQERHVGAVATTLVTGAFVIGVGGVCAAKCDRDKLAAGIGIGALVIVLTVAAFSYR